MFDPVRLRSQHYVPVFWQRRFAGVDGVLWSLRDGAVEVAGARNLMCEDWLYTIFNQQWIASNLLERVASRKENEAAEILGRLDVPNNVGTTEDQLTLRYFFAFSVCRHPDTMSMGFRRGKQLAQLISSIHSMDSAEFAQRASRFGLSAIDVALMIAATRDVTEEQLKREALEIEGLIPQHPELPQQIAIAEETIQQVYFRMSTMEVTILDVPPGSDFILGDTPFPPNLLQGFTLPISSRLALLWESGGADAFPDWTRRQATRAEVEESNNLQATNALRVIVGPSRATLEAYRQT